MTSTRDNEVGKEFREYGGWTPPSSRQAHQAPKPDLVNNPPHYDNVPGIECIEVTQHFNFNRGNAIKYVWRAGHKHKDTEKQDLQKAIWYLEKEIARLDIERLDNVE